MIRRHVTFQLGAALASVAIGAAAASAATSITNSLTSFTGDSTQSATQAALAGVGLNFTSTAGFEGPSDATVVLDANGPAFGTFFTNDGGRNFLRTVATDYANHSFVAEVTWVSTSLASQSAYFGLGSAEFGSFRIADWGTPNSAAMLFLELDGTPPSANTLKNDNGTGKFTPLSVPTFAAGTNRLRMSYDWFSKTADFAVDLAYAGGAFTADINLPSLNLLDLYGGDGWSAEEARVFFGGDDGSVFKDFSVTLSSPSTVLGDFNGSGTITAADWIILRNNQNGDLSALTFAQAYALGDITADKLNDYADFKLFKDIYDGFNGAGSFVAMLASIPEPVSGSMALTAALLGLPAVRRRSRR